MILTLKEYFKKYDTDEKYMRDYLKRLSKINVKGDAFPEELVLSGMIKWDEEEAYCWSGPFSKYFCFFRIVDYTNTCSVLDSIETIKQKEKDYLIYSLYSINNRHTVKRIFPEAVDYFYFEQKSSDGTICSRSEMTHQELLRFLSLATPEEKEEREKYIKEKSKLFNPKEHLSIEFPVDFYMTGNDDTSYSKLFDTPESALKELNKISENPTFDFLLKKCKFFSD